MVLVLTASCLSSCSTVEKAWTGTKNTLTGLFSGDDAAAAATPDSAGPPSLASVPTTAPERLSSQEAGEGLVADREQAQYTDQGGRREPLTVRPLTETASTPQDVAQMSAPPVPAAARVDPVTRMDTPATPTAPVPPRTTALAERLGAAPPPPPPADGQSPNAPPMALRGSSSAPTMSGAPPRPLLPAVDEYGSDTVVIDGRGVRGGQAVLGNPQIASGPRAVFDPGNSSVSSEVAVITFAPGAATLAASAKAELANIAALRAQVDGAIRIVGKGDNASARANAVARELRRLGVPAQRVFAGGADGAEPGNEADIFLDY
jgi:outer membrane protein OmpA-like peptidoglycan-associated protein